MKPILWRLTAASTGVLVALSMNVGPAQATSSDNHRPERNQVQVADQAARTEQDADSYAKSEQFLPVNANVPVQILSLGSNGGDTKQSNTSTAKSAAVNEARTDQSVHQSQKTVKPHAPKHEPKGHDRPKGHQAHDGRKGHKGHDGWKDHGPKGHGPKGHGPKGHDGWKDHGPKGHDGWKDHGRKGHGPSQESSQKARTDQDAESRAKSEQILPVNVNAPVQILSLGHNGGDTKQSNNSTAESAAVNEARTDQSAKQHQQAGPAPASQQASQVATTDQDAQSEATSKQILPVNVNAPVQILSLGHNGGDTKQSNNSTAESAAVNEAQTDQSAKQHQQAGPAPASQQASQVATTDQDAQSEATSKQILPVNANVPVQILSLGSNGGDTAQSNSSTAESAAVNQAGTSQGVGQVQGALGGLLG